MAIQARRRAAAIADAVQVGSQPDRAIPCECGRGCVARALNVSSGVTCSIRRSGVTRRKRTGKDGIENAGELRSRLASGNVGETGQWPKRKHERLRPIRHCGVTVTARNLLTLDRAVCSGAARHQVAIGRITWICICQGRRPGVGRFRIVDSRIGRVRVCDCAGWTLHPKRLGACPGGEAD